MLPLNLGFEIGLVQPVSFFGLIQTIFIILRFRYLTLYFIGGRLALSS